MTYHELDTIVLTRDIPEHVLPAGTVGVIVHLHTALVAEVEFSGPTGAAILVTAVPTDAMRLAHPGDLPAHQPAT
jgi:Domain of unknown function (DUF4926)